MAILGNLAKLIRSKNAGAFKLTFDIMFEDEETYRRVITANVVTKESFSTMYGVPVKDIFLFHHDPARAIKVTIPRPIASSDIEDSDCYGCQQYGPLVNLEVPDP